MAILAEGSDIKFFYFLPCPRSFAQKLEAGVDAWVAVKAVDANLIPKLFPAIIIYELHQNTLQCFAVQGIVFLFFHTQVLVLASSVHYREYAILLAMARHTCAQPISQTQSARRLSSGNCC